MKKTLTIFALTFSLCFSAGADQYDSLYYKDFVKFLQVTGSEAVQKTMIKQMFAQFKKAAPNKVLFDDLEAAAVAELADLNKELFPIYKKHMSHEDLKTIIKFYETPAAQRMVKSQPAIVQESFQVGQAWGQKLAQRIMSKQ
jgi:hypothetical protein